MNISFPSRSFICNSLLLSSVTQLKPYSPPFGLCNRLVISHQPVSNSVTFSCLWCHWWDLTTDTVNQVRFHWYRTALLWIQFSVSSWNFLNKNTGILIPIIPSQLWYCSTRFFYLFCSPFTHTPLCSLIKLSWFTQLIQLTITHLLTTPSNSPLTRQFCLLHISSSSCNDPNLLLDDSWSPVLESS